MSIFTGKRIAFRADASVQIGNGHIVRCLTLATEFKAQGAECLFISREHSGHAFNLIRQHGFHLHPLPDIAGDRQISSDRESEYAEDSDASQTAAHLAGWRPDWLIVDHYGLNARWERRLRTSCNFLMVIDDLAKRCHDCDLLLDQTLNRSPDHYANLAPERCKLLLGQHYGILRPEFAQLRPYSLARRHAPRLRRVLITMGGTDQPNATGQVLDALKVSKLPDDCTITIIMGAQAPWLEAVKHQAEEMHWNTEILVDVSNMAQLMADSDLAIGAVGGTAWERCCLGLPTLMVILADNQKTGALALESIGAAKLLGSTESIRDNLPISLNMLLETPQELAIMSQRSSQLTDGLGVQNIFSELGINL